MSCLTIKLGVLTAFLHYNFEWEFQELLSQNLKYVVIDRACLGIKGLMFDTL